MDTTDPHCPIPATSHMWLFVLQLIVAKWCYIVMQIQVLRGQWTLDSAHAERTFLLLRKVLTVALWSESRNISDKKKGIWERSPIFSNRNKPTCHCRSERKPKVVSRSGGRCQKPHPQQLIHGGQPQPQVLPGAYLRRKVKRWRRHRGVGI